MSPEAWRIMRALAAARRECDKELANRRGYNARLYWAARRRSLTDALLIVRGRA